jgi:hypothetical protein
MKNKVMNELHLCDEFKEGCYPGEEYFYYRRYYLEYLKEKTDVPVKEGK